MTATAQDFEIHQGEMIGLSYSYDPAGSDPTGAVAKFVVIDVDGVVWDGAVAPATAPLWTISFTIWLTSARRLPVRPYEYHVCVEKAGAMQVVAKGLMNVLGHPEHPH